MHIYYQDDSVTLYLGDNADVLPNLADATFDLVLTDPPYGINKARWDSAFPTAWIEPTFRLVKPGHFVATLTSGGEPLRYAIEALGDRYRSTFCAWLSNGMKRGPISFSNWTAIILASTDKPKWRAYQDVIRVTINTREKIDHPTPKPLDLMLQVVERLSQPGDWILDPFAGSGTTLLAAKLQGRRAVGIEIEEAYCEVIASRLQNAARAA